MFRGSVPSRRSQARGQWAIPEIDDRLSKDATELIDDKPQALALVKECQPKSAPVVVYAPFTEAGDLARAQQTWDQGGIDPEPAAQNGGIDFERAIRVAQDDFRVAAQRSMPSRIVLGALARSLTPPSSGRAEIMRVACA